MRCILQTEMATAASIGHRSELGMQELWGADMSSSGPATIWDAFGDILTAFDDMLAETLGLLGLSWLFALFAVPPLPPPSPIEAWCQGCDRVVLSRWLKWTDDGRYRCDVCRGETDQPMTVIDLTASGGPPKMLAVRTGSHMELMTAQEFAETHGRP